MFLPLAGFRVLPWVAFLGYIAAGWLYNAFASRQMILGTIEISAAFGLFFLAFGTAWAGSASRLVIAVVVYGILWTAFQISIAGFCKDLAHGGERNLLRNLGARVTPGISPLVDAELIRPEALLPSLVVSQRVWALAIALSTAKAIAIGAVGWLVLGPEWGLIIGAVSGGFFVAYTVALLRPGPFDRPRRVKIAGLGEAGSYVFLVIALAPVLWPWLWVVFIIAPVVWYISMNRILWSTSGSAWAPGV